MLTPATCHVNDERMTHGGTAHSPNRPVSAQMLEHCVNTQLRRQRPQRVLLISDGTVPWALEETSGTFVLRLQAADTRVAGAIVCMVDQLPFADGSFDLVILYAVLADGSEKLLVEASRMLKPGGQLLLIGPGRFGGCRGKPEHVALKPGRLCRVLEQHSFRIARCEGMGLRGRAVNLASRWHLPMLPWCEIIAIRARHRDHGTMVTPLRFRHARASGARGAALDGLSRQAVQ